jgi:hypothetical protein
MSYEFQADYVTMLTKRNTITDLLRFFESQRIDNADCDKM